MSEWIDVKTQLPPFGVFVEVVYKRGKVNQNDLFRGFCALVDGGVEYGTFWTKDHCDERDWGDFGVIRWREMRPDHLGRVAVLSRTKKNFWKVKLVKKR